MKIRKTLIFAKSFRNGLYPLVFLHQKKILKFVRKCLAFLKSYFRFPKNSKRRFGEGGKRLSKKRKLKNLLFL